MAEIRVQRKKGIPLIWLLLALIILALAIWFLVDRRGGDENAALAPSERIEELGPDVKVLAGLTVRSRSWAEPERGKRG